MEISCVQLDDLPDEILLIIFKKIWKVEILYSLLGVNKRLTKIVHDSIFTNYLTLFCSLPNCPVYPLPDRILDRFCLEILPEIPYKIKWLDLEPLSMKRILLSTNYLNLFGLGLYNIQVKNALDLFTDETALTHILKDQITALVIDLTNDGTIESRNKNIFIFTHIFTTFPKLQCLDFNPSLRWGQELLLDSSLTVFSSTLLELKIYLDDFIDCLYLLDGRFNQLQILHVNIPSILYMTPIISSKEKLPNLRCFSLNSDNYTDGYNELIVPLLQRMSNLEKLQLYFTTLNTKCFLDGNDLKKNILNHIPRLQKFVFNIYSIISYESESNLPSNEDIQETFRDFKDNQVISCVDYFPDDEGNRGRCHIYSYPYTWKFYNDITINFPGGLFNCVHEISLNDERPFQHEFFLRIAQSFPFVKKIKLENEKSQNDKQCRKSKQDNQDLLIIKYPHLTYLDLAEAHDDYVEQFLLDNKTCLPNDVSLRVSCYSLKRVTHNFTRDAIRINCAKLRRIDLEYLSMFTPHLHGIVLQHLFDYFPRTEIIY